MVALNRVLVDPFVTPQTQAPHQLILDIDASDIALRDAAENRIKETPSDLFGTRTSRQKFLANGLRSLFSALADTLMQRLRELALASTERALATAATIRMRRLKIGATVVRKTRRIRILLASHHPLHDLLLAAAPALDVS